ncbi:MAG: helix-turn-helix domain-containing protein [Paracoccaceae bacterium]|nr:helix-turn-helix domain-containing protein [Paracoccaceae bacterium]
MTAELPEITAPEDEVIGLRDRKKAQRRDRIIAAARALFAERGVDATTITDIAEACEISAPTVFNYFGSKDGILIAIIDEGTRAARESEKVMPRPAGTPLDKVLLDLFSRIAAQTLLIASKRVWRYAESAVIRHPETELSQTYREVGTKLVEAIADVLRACDLSTRAGAPADIPLLAEMLHDLWMPCFIELIRGDDMTVADHDAMARARVLPVIALVFDDACLAGRNL